MDIPWHSAFLFWSNWQELSQMSMFTWKGSLRTHSLSQSARPLLKTRETEIRNRTKLGWQHWLSLSCWPPKLTHTLPQHTEPGSRHRATRSSLHAYIASESKASVLRFYLSGLGTASWDLVAKGQVTHPCVPNPMLEEEKDTFFSKC